MNSPESIPVAGGGQVKATLKMDETAQSQEMMLATNGSGRGPDLERSPSGPRFSFPVGAQMTKWGWTGWAPESQKGLGGGSTLEKLALRKRFSEAF